MSTTERIGDHAQQVADTAREQTRDLAHSATEHARTLVDQAASELRSQGDEQGRHLAQGIRAITEDLRGMAGHSSGSTPLADVMCGIADAGERMAGRLDREGMAGMARQLSDYGRRHPLRFLAFSAAAGVLAGRLIRNADTTAIRDAVSPTGDDDAVTPSVGTAPSTGAAPMGSSIGTEPSTGSGAGFGDDEGLPPVELPGDVAPPSGAPATPGFQEKL